MRKPIIDKAEVSVDLPGRMYHGAFGRDSSYDVGVDEHGVHLAVDHQGEMPRHARVHLHHHLFAGILDAVADELAEMGKLPTNDLEDLQPAVAKLAAAIAKLDKA